MTGAVKISKTFVTIMVNGCNDSIVLKISNEFLKGRVDMFLLAANERKKIGADE